MPHSNTEKSQILRKRRAYLGLKEIRGIWTHKDNEQQLKIKIREWIKVENERNNIRY